MNLSLLSRGAIRWLFLLMLTLMSAVSLAQGGRFNGTVYDDINMNGHRDEGEMGVQGVQVRAFNLTQPFFTFAMVTNANGNFVKDNLEFGVYGITADIPNGYELTEPHVGGLVTVNVGPGTNGHVDIGIGKPCVKFVTKKILWLPNEPGCVSWTFTITNYAAYPIAHIFFQPTGGVVVFAPNTNLANYMPINPAIPPGGSQTFTVKVCGVQPNTDLCINLTAHSYNLALCCPGSACFTLPECDCFQFTEEEVICNADGTFTYYFCIQSLSQTPLYYLLLAPDNDVQMNPNFIVLNPPLLFGQTYCGSFTLPQTAGGRPYCFFMSAADRNFMMCCSKRHCIELPPCGGCTDLPGICAGKMPVYQDDPVGGGGANYASAAFVTTDALPGGTGIVLHMMNLSGYQCNPPALGANWSAQTPYSYTGPGAGWNKADLGTIFGLTIDPGGNVYVTYTSMYWGDAPGTIGTLGGGTRGGCIYKIQNGSGTPTLFTPTALPNTGGPNEFPGLGNITYDYDHNQFFVTNMEDGKIYRVNMAGAWVAAQAFDPMTPDDGQAGFAPLGERLWGVQYHRGRVYYAVWTEDFTRPNALLDNTIRSVAIDNTGAFIASSDQLEVTMPAYQSNWSNPVSDISFSPEGRMGVAEKSMYGDGGAYAHLSRAMEFRCMAGMWTQWVGPDDPTGYTGGDVFRINNSTAGGLDYDYSTQCQGNMPAQGRRIWWTADWQLGGSVYGLVGFPINGGGAPANIYMDINLIFGTQDKMYLGDTEIPCPTDHAGGPSTFNVTAGTLFNGQLDDLVATDGKCVCIFNDDNTLQTQIVFTKDGLTKPDFLLQFMFVAGIQQKGMSMVIEWFDYSTNHWVVVDSRAAPTEKTQILVERTGNVGRYLNANGQARARVTWAPINDDSPGQDGWLALIDEATWMVD